MVSARLMTRLLDLTMMLFLARILLPVDFGVVAIAMTLISIVEAALELPVNQALLRLDLIEASHYNTAFTVSALRCLVLASILIGAAYPFAAFYHDHRLVALIATLTLAPLARGLVSPRLAEFQKEMSFWRDFAIEMIGKLAGFAVGVLTALWTHSYWSIAAGTIASPLMMAVVSYGFAPYRPKLSLSERKMFAGFVGWMSAAQIVSALNWQVERLLLGKLQSPTRLGLFTTASDLATIPSLALFGPIMRPLLAGFTRIKADQAKLARGYQAASAAILMVGLPLLVGESLVAKPLVLLVLGERWRPAAPLLVWLALSMIPSLLTLAATPLIMAFGRTEIVLRRNLVEFFVKLPIVVVGAINFGFAGIIAGRLIAETVSAVLYMRAVRGFTGLSEGRQLAAFWRIVLSALTMVPAVLFCQAHLPDPHGNWQAALCVMAAAGTGAITYCAALLTIWRGSGRPAGLEATALGTLSRLVPKFRRRAVRARRT